LPRRRPADGEVPAGSGLEGDARTERRARGSHIWAQFLGLAHRRGASMGIGGDGERATATTTGGAPEGEKRGAQASPSGGGRLQVAGQGGENQQGAASVEVCGDVRTSRKTNVGAGIDVDLPAHEGSRGVATMVS